MVPDSLCTAPCAKSLPPYAKSLPPYAKSLVPRLEEVVLSSQPFFGCARKIGLVDILFCFHSLQLQRWLCSISPSLPSFSLYTTSVLHTLLLASSVHRMASNVTPCPSHTRDSCYWWQKTLADIYTLFPS